MFDTQWRIPYSQRSKTKLLSTQRNQDGPRENLQRTSPERNHDLLRPEEIKRIAYGTREIGIESHHVYVVGHAHYFHAGTDQDLRFHGQPFVDIRVIFNQKKETREPFVSHPFFHHLVRKYLEASDIWRLCQPTFGPMDQFHETCDFGLGRIRGSE